MKAHNPAEQGKAHLAASTQEAILQTLTNDIPAFIAVYAFGSAGTQYELPASDVDLAFLSAHVEDTVVVWNTAQTMAARLGRDVDLVDLRKASTVMAANIIVSGTQLLCTDKSRCAEFEARTLSDYARLNEERAGILKDIQARGSVHA